MSISTDAPAMTQNVQVRTDPTGKPLAIRHNGQIWLVDPDTESQHQPGADACRTTRRAASVRGGELDTIESWRVQARLGSTSALRTFTLRREPLSNQWGLENISDGG
ncbi:hypothetical protein ACFVTM_06105 [Arthrobacter sp. NPDC058130]|uniref:hypothetical protein n=1 Tax=Arthrobacter sp. NPDC058130 TaxID=3346353 RepID=UPI0036E46A9E